MSHFRVHFKHGSILKIVSWTLSVGTSIWIRVRTVFQIYFSLCVWIRIRTVFRIIFHSVFGSGFEPYSELFFTLVWIRIRTVIQITLLHLHDFPFISLLWLGSGFEPLSKLFVFTMRYGSGFEPLSIFFCSLCVLDPDSNRFPNRHLN